MAGERQYGVTKPISMAGPTEADLHRTRQLEEFLVSAGLYESPEDGALRKEVLAQIDKIAKAWVKRITDERGYGEQLVEDANAKIYTFGSYRLSVHGPGADLDTLCVGPCYVIREVVVDFTATWCGPCQIISPVFVELSKKFSEIFFLKVDVDELRDVAQEWDVQAMPTFIFIKDGKAVDKFVGANKAELQRKVAALATQETLVTQA